MRKIKRSIFILIVLLILISFTVQAQFVHRVSTGEDLFQIAKKYSVTVDDIIQTNNLLKPENIIIGQVLVIPDLERTGIYRVQKGDTLYEISQKLKIPTSIIQEENNLKSKDRLYINQPLTIPLRYRYPQNYTVKTGDTLYKIADKFSISISEIISINKLTNNSIIVDQVLKIPVLKTQTWSKYSSKYPNTLYYKGITSGRKVALTFDDGPDSVYTEKVLEILNKHNVKGTFFLVGDNVKTYPDISKKIVEDGHLVASHTLSHANLSRLNKSEIKYQLKETENIINKNTGVNIHLLRPPWGFVSETLLDVAQDLDYKIINWNIDSEDWNGLTVDQILLNTMPYIDENSIILFHSAGGKNQNLNATIAVLPELIKTLKQNGYSFVTVDKIINTIPYRN